MGENLVDIEGKKEGQSDVGLSVMMVFGQMINRPEKPFAEILPIPNSYFPRNS